MMLNICLSSKEGKRHKGKLIKKLFLLILNINLKVNAKS